MVDCYCDYDPPEVWTRRAPKARKEHRCYECGCRIQPGEEYEYVWGVWEGWPDTYKTCQRCLALREWVKAHVPCFCWSHGGMLDDAAETIDQYRNECEGLWFGFLRKRYAIWEVRRTQAREQWGHA